MKLAVSDLGFNGIESVADSLQQLGIEYIEIVPTKIKPYSAMRVDDIKMYRDILSDYNLKPYSFLSLFYGTDVKDISEVDKIIDHFKTLIEYAQAVDVKKLVFGSPVLRKKITGWESHLQNIFVTLDSVLKDTGVSVIIEPVSANHGAEFWHTVKEVTEFIKSNKLKHIFTMIDTNNSLTEGEDPALVYLQHQRLIKHIHITEPGFGELENLAFHMRFSNTIRNYPDVITHEITNKEVFHESIKTFSQIYK
jgi:sugar phosphate isomerase/epimerase